MIKHLNFRGQQINIQLINRCKNLNKNNKVFRLIIKEVNFSQVTEVNPIQTKFIFQTHAPDLMAQIYEK